MGKIGLIDVDSHNFPNLALMRIAAYHKSIGDTVEWWHGDLEHYDIVYKSKIFSDIYSQDVPDPFNADKVTKGGTGYCISLGEDGKEHFDKSKNEWLPDYIEAMYPDYSIYPQFDFNVSMTSRGCPRGCPFCHVQSKEGNCSVKVADVNDFWRGENKKIEVLDSNLTACKDKRDLFQQYKETRAEITFNGGLDIRLLNDDDIQDLNGTRVKQIHFAWDKPEEDLEEKFKYFATNYKPHLIAKHGNKGVVYILVNYNSTMEQNLDRVYKIRDIGLAPYIMIYDKPNAPKELKQLQRYVNNRFIFYKLNSFDEYLRS